MSALLPQLRPLDDSDWSRYFYLIVFFVLPLVARLLKALFRKFGGEREPTSGGDLDEGGRRLARAEQQRREEEGEDLWRRLARGEEPTPSQAPPPAPVRIAPAPTEPVMEPVPLSILGPVSEPGEAAEVSLEEEAEPSPLAVLAESRAGTEQTVEPRWGLVLGRAELRRAVVLSEILAPPLSVRGSV